MCSRGLLGDAEATVRGTKRPLSRENRPALHRDYSSQFSTAKSGTRLKCRELLVTSVAPNARACAAMSVSTTGGVFFGRANTIMDVTLAYEMQMVSNGGDSLKGIATGFTIPPRFIVGSLNHVVQMRVDAIADKRLSIIVPVYSPGIGCAVSERLPDMSFRMIAINAAVEANSFLC